MSPRETRVHAPGKPSSREATEWYFQRFVPVPAGGEEFVIFNRSWYNRAGVERVMGFAKPKEVEAFFDSVVPFEEMLMRDGIQIRKYYLDISRKEQKKRLKERHKDPLKQWKISPIDEAGAEALGRLQQGTRRHVPPHQPRRCPLRIVKADVKKIARLELMRDCWAASPTRDQKKKLLHPDRSIVFPWSDDAQKDLSQ